jgi:hypothetical protein
MLEETLLDRVHRLQDGLVAEATGMTFDGGEVEYKKLRTEICNVSSVSSNVPPFLRRCSDLAQFWGWIKYERPTYAERRNLIWQAFGQLTEQLEFGSQSPINQHAVEILQIKGPADVHLYWDKAVSRVKNDPEGAITMARTLMEGCCKAILTDLEVQYSNKEDIPALWGKCSLQLGLAPSQHQEEVFKTILGNCVSIVSNISALRNKLGDAHVDQPKPVRPTPRHAALVVNLSGAMTTFLVETWHKKKTE